MHAQNGAFVCEPAILVRRKGRPPQVWSCDKLDAKLVDMRELYTEWQAATSAQEVLQSCAPLVPF